MVTLAKLRREKKAEIIRLAGVHGCRNVRVFGSVTTGENNFSSDVDFLVDLEIEFSPDGAIEFYYLDEVTQEERGGRVGPNLVNVTGFFDLIWR